MIDLKNLKSLIRLMVAHDLTDLELQDASGERVAIRRGRGQPVAPHPTPAAAGASPSEAVAPVPGPPADADLRPIVSPMVGTFYAAASPDAKPFVGVGGRVAPDTVVCVIEAMKVFNEIKAEVAGTIERVVAENGRAVEFGQPLFLVRPG